MPSGSAATLLNGELPLRYCSSHFACRVPTWGLPAHGHAQGLLAELAGAGEVPRGGQVQRARLPGLVGGARVSGSGRALGGRLLRNPPAHLAGYGTEGSFSVSSKGLEEIEGRGFQVSSQCCPGSAVAAG